LPLGPRPVEQQITEPLFESVIACNTGEVMTCPLGKAKLPREDFKFTDQYAVVVLPERV
jgi:hypothetical protein